MISVVVILVSELLLHEGFRLDDGKPSRLTLLGIRFLLVREAREDDRRRALSRCKSRAVLMCLELHSLFENTLFDLSELFEEEMNERHHRLCVLNKKAMGVGDQIPWVEGKEEAYL